MCQGTTGDIRPREVPPMKKPQGFSDRLELYLGLTWEIFLLVLATVGIYAEHFYRCLFPPPLKSLHKEIILVSNLLLSDWSNKSSDFEWLKSWFLSTICNFQVTGSAHGIGRETCIKLAATGATLICWDIEKEPNEKLVEDLKFLGTRAHAFEIDVADRAAVELLAKRVKKEIGNVTMVVNNAGIMPCHEFLSHNPREIERSFQVNVFSHFWILREFLPGMIERNDGHIVTVASAAGLIPTRNLVPYCATKHAVCGYVDALKEELRHHPTKPTNIRFTTVYPFSCRTKLIQNIKCNSRF